MEFGLWAGVMVVVGVLCVVVQCVVLLLCPEATLVSLVL